jgi:hypothetical protein
MKRASEIFVLYNLSKSLVFFELVAEILDDAE